MKTAFDTSVLVAALLSWHDRHTVALREVQSALTAPNSMVIPSPALVESYSVMTRLPSPWRVSATDAHRLLDGSFRSRCLVVALAGDDVWRMLDAALDREITGGTAHDAHIAACAELAGAHRLLTFNLRHFERLELGVMDVAEPC